MSLSQKIRAFLLIDQIDAPKDELDYMSPLSVAAHMRPSAASRILLVSIAGLVVLFFLWAAISRIEVVVRGSGQIVPSAEPQIVQSLEGGILAELQVKEGDIVKKGQVLAKISDVAFASEERGTAAQSYALKAKKARLQAEAQGEDFVMPTEVSEKAPDIAANEEKLYHSRQEELANSLSILQSKIEKAEADIAETESQISRFATNAALLKDQLAITSKMVAQKAMPQIEEIKLKRELNDNNGALAAARESLAGLLAELAANQRGLEDQRSKFRSQALGELNDVEAKIAGLEESLTSLGDRLDRTEMRAPLDGVVNAISVKTIGGVIEPAQPMFEIIPVGDDLKITAKINPNDIAFVAQGQPATVRISAYDSTRYGTLKGKVTRVGASTMSAGEGKVYFEIDVETEKNHLGTDAHPLPITPGMFAEVDVITDHRTILSYLAYPVMRAKERAFRER
ncbi:MAG: HlyD family type I secretion periplasmic adaptor subunit [Pseudobdellovibrionaceae bacterium]